LAKGYKKGKLEFRFLLIPAGRGSYDALQT
jgi:hypothetical protein